MNLYREIIRIHNLHENLDVLFVIYGEYFLTRIYYVLPAIMPDRKLPAMFQSQAFPSINQKAFIKKSNCIPSGLTINPRAANHDAWAAVIVRNSF